jgi:A/G-specific adenine glycosylase
MVSMEQFKTVIYDYYKANKRTFSWRTVIDPYRVTVSEIMLQQTQTHRVEKKFELFIAAFPNFIKLAEAPLRDVLFQWQGLGYNRRALALHKIAQNVIAEHHGILPNNPETLIQFPGIGSATAASICAFAFNAPTVFIETNIRSVFIHFFFQGREHVSDKEIMPFIEESLDRENAREWYYALMDYGVALKKQMPNPNRRSAHHARQSAFAGSDRQIRGQLIKLLLDQKLSLEELEQSLDKDPVRIKRSLQALIQEGLIKKSDSLFTC